MFVRNNDNICDLICNKYPLILRENAAIRIRFSHASQGGVYVTGRMLSNTLLTCPQVWNSLGKLRVIPDKIHELECCVS